MSYEKDTREIAYIATGDPPGSRVSIIEVENVSFAHILLSTEAGGRKGQREWYFTILTFPSSNFAGCNEGD